MDETTQGTNEIMHSPQSVDQLLEVVDGKVGQLPDDTIAEIYPGARTGVHELNDADGISTRYVVMQIPLGSSRTGSVAIVSQYRSGEHKFDHITDYYIYNEGSTMKVHKFDPVITHVVSNVRTGGGITNEAYWTHVFDILRDRDQKREELRVDGNTQASELEIEELIGNLTRSSVRNEQPTADMPSPWRSIIGSP